MQTGSHVSRFILAYTPQFAAFVAVGLLNTVFGYGVFLGGLWWGFSPGIALTIATIAGAFFNYLTTGRMVFRENSIHRLPHFLTVYVVVYVLNRVVLELLIAQSYAPWLAQAMILPFVVVASYVTMKFWVFRARGASK